MADVKKIATRESYGNALKELGAVAENLVVLDADLAGATKTGTFQKAYPDRFFDCGIAESNMMGVAAGLSTMGLVPFASTFAMFAAGRAFEQIRNTIGYPHLNVKIGATHGGISVGEDGASHQCCEDFGLMRTLPGMVVMCPADDVEAAAMVKAAYEYVGPVYMRFARLAAPVFHDPGQYTFQIGKGELLLRHAGHSHGRDKPAAGDLMFIVQGDQIRNRQILRTVAGAVMTGRAGKPALARFLIRKLDQHIKFRFVQRTVCLPG